MNRILTTEEVVFSILDQLQSEFKTPEIIWDFMHFNDDGSPVKDVNGNDTVPELSVSDIRLIIAKGRPPPRPLQTDRECVLYVLGQLRVKSAKMVHSFLPMLSMQKINHIIREETERHRASS